MKKSRLLILLVLLLAAVALFCLACSKKAESADVIDVTGGPTAQTFTGDSPKGRLDDMPADMEKTDGASESADVGARGASQQTDVIGEVDSIVGNEATLTLMNDDGSGSYTATGETASYLIPVGMSVGSGDYSSVSSGMILGLDIEDDTVMSVKVLKRAS